MYGLGLAEGYSLDFTQTFRPGFAEGHNIDFTHMFRDPSHALSVQRRRGSVRGVSVSRLYPPCQGDLRLSKPEGCMRVPSPPHDEQTQVQLQGDFCRHPTPFC